MWSLILKNIKGNFHIIFLRVLLPMAVGTSLYNARFQSADANIIAACTVIAAACTGFYFSEILHKRDVMTCSLPVKRVAIVIARYLTSVMLMLVGSAFYFGCMVVASLIFRHPTTEFHQLLHPGVLFMIGFFVFVHMSIFLPAVFTGKFIVAVLAFIVAMASAILGTVYVFDLEGISWNTHIVAGDHIIIIKAIVIMSLVLFLSISFSTCVYRGRDL